MNIAEHEARLAELDAALARIAVLEHKLMEAEHPNGTYTRIYGPGYSHQEVMDRFGYTQADLDSAE